MLRDIVSGKCIEFQKTEFKIGFQLLGHYHVLSHPFADCFKLMFFYTSLPW